MYSTSSYMYIGTRNILFVYWSIATMINHHLPSQLLHVYISMYNKTMKWTCTCIRHYPWIITTKNTHNNKLHLQIKSKAILWQRSIVQCPLNKLIVRSDEIILLLYATPPENTYSTKQPLWLILFHIIDSLHKNFTAQ